jgi:hypothetical protein
MKLIRHLTFLTIVLRLYSCSSAQSNIDNLVSIIETVESCQEGASEEELNKMDNMVKELQNDLEINRNKYTVEQIKQIGILKGRYKAILFKKGMSDFKDAVNDMGNEIEGFMEGLSDEERKQK